MWYNLTFFVVVFLTDVNLNGGRTQQTVSVKVQCE